MNQQTILSILGLVTAAGTGMGCLPSSPSKTPPPPDAAPPAQVFHSCLEVLKANPQAATGKFQLTDAKGVAYDAWCDMVSDGGGWTLVLKADGTSAASNFGYDDPLWTNADTLNDRYVDDSRSEAKYHAFSEVPFSNVRLVVESDAEHTLELEAGSTSMLDLMNGPSIDLPLTRDQWLSLMPGATVQQGCMRGGIDVFTADPYYRVRLGMIANQEATCLSPDSYVGIGGGGGTGNQCYPDLAVPPSPSVGTIDGGICQVAAGSAAGSSGAAAGSSAPPPPQPTVPAAETGHAQAAFAYVYVR